MIAGLEVTVLKEIITFSTLPTLSLQNRALQKMIYPSSDLMVHTRFSMPDLICPSTKESTVHSKTVWPNKVDVIGVAVSEVNYQQAVDSIFHAAHGGESGIVSCHAVHAIVTLGSDEKLRAMANTFSMITPDGQPVRWAMNLLNGSKLKKRVYGPDLMLDVCQRAAEEGLPIYLYGGQDQVSIDLQRSLLNHFPKLVIAGAETPPFRELTEEENAQTVQRINSSGAKITFIGLGCPKQDVFAYEHRDTINGIQICVGAAFDFHAGAKPMAPKWMQASGLEWLFRLSSEPGRLWKRYLLTNSLFVWKVAKAYFLPKSKSAAG